MQVHTGKSAGAVPEKNQGMCLVLDTMEGFWGPRRRTATKEANYGGQT